MHPSMRGSRLASWCKWFTHTMAIAFHSMGPSHEQNGKDVPHCTTCFSKIGFYFSRALALFDALRLQDLPHAAERFCEVPSTSRNKLAHLETSAVAYRFFWVSASCTIGMVSVWACPENVPPGLNKYEENLKLQLQQPAPVKLLQSSKPTIPLQ